MSSAIAQWTAATAAPSCSSELSPAPTPGPAPPSPRAAGTSRAGPCLTGAERDAPFIRSVGRVHYHVHSAVLGARKVGELHVHLRRVPVTPQPVSRHLDGIAGDPFLPGPTG